MTPTIAQRVRAALLAPATVTDTGQHETARAALDRHGAHRRDDYALAALATDLIEHARTQRGTEPRAVIAACLTAPGAAPAWAQRHLSGDAAECVHLVALLTAYAVHLTRFTTAPLVHLLSALADQAADS